ncbi:GNAT family N-acetyltransferase [Vallitalea sediminicola]
MQVNSKYIIRKADINDVIEISQIFIEFVGKNSDIIAMKKQIEVISNNPNYFVAVACYREKVIGTAMGVVCYDLCGSCKQFMVIENVAVLPSYRGKGIGKLLMEAQEKFGRKNNCQYTILVSGSKRTDAHKFYETMGYSKEYGFKKKLK